MSATAMSERLPSYEETVALEALFLEKQELALERKRLIEATAELEKLKKEMEEKIRKEMEEKIREEMEEKIRKEVEEKIRNESIDFSKFAQKTVKKVMSIKESIPKSTPPKRALTAFILFCKDGREEVKKNNPSLKATEILSELGKMWKSLSDLDLCRKNRKNVHRGTYR